MGNVEVDAMYAAAFRDWLAKAKELTPAQRQQALEGLRQEWRSAPDPLAVVLDASRACPHCHHTVCRRWGQAHGSPRLRCAACGTTFNVHTGTPLAHLRHRERWGEYAQALIEGQMVRAAACRCGVHKNTSLRWRHRFLALPAEVKPSRLPGIVEADETYFLESHKGERNLSRPPRKRGGVAAKRGLSDEQIPVLVVRDRNTTTTDAVLPNANSARPWGPCWSPSWTPMRCCAPTAARSTTALPGPPTSLTPR
jgi:transposase-like protein